jgi:chorismate lyase/3-hydroxybenzoate synthase
MHRTDLKAGSAPAAQVAFVDQVPATRTLLSEIHFGASPLPPGEGLHPAAWVGMPLLVPGAHIELWTSPQPVVAERSGPLVVARNRDVLFGCFTADSPADFAVFEGRVQEAYARLLTLVDVEGYPHLVRMWNYFPGIGDRDGELDRYMVFSRGRHRAIEAHYGGRFTGRLPAASAVGSRHGGLVIYFLAARQPARHRENPRQLSAYCYPAQYGPKSPSFARATLHRQAGADLLYISGTASIVGHESRHPGEPLGQLDETLTNIRILIESTAAEEGVAFHGLESLAWVKVYIRRRDDAALIRRRLEAVLPSGARCMYLEADICRPELLLEVEAIARAGRD